MRKIVYIYMSYVFVCSMILGMNIINTAESGTRFHVNKKNKLGYNA